MWLRLKWLMRSEGDFMQTHCGVSDLTRKHKIWEKLSAIFVSVSSRPTSEWSNFSKTQTYHCEKLENWPVCICSLIPDEDDNNDNLIPKARLCTAEHFVLFIIELGSYSFHCFISVWLSLFQRYQRVPVSLSLTKTHHVTLKTSSFP